MAYVNAFLAVLPVPHVIGVHYFFGDLTSSFTITIDKVKILPRRIEAACGSHEFSSQAATSKSREEPLINTLRPTAVITGPSVPMEARSSATSCSTAN